MKGKSQKKEDAGARKCRKVAKQRVFLFDRLTSHKQPASTHCFLEPYANDNKGENVMYVQ